MRNACPVVVALLLLACVFGGCGGGGGGGNDGVISFLGSAFSVNEDGSVIDVISLRRVGDGGDVSVTVTLTDGSATAPSDYDGTPIVVVWLAGDLADKTIAVPIVNDHDDEPAEFLTMTIGSPTGGAVVGSPASAALTIVDDDVAGTVQFDASAYSYGENGAPVGMPVAVTRTGGMDGDVNVTVISADGTANSDPLSAVEPVDYTPVAFSVFFADQSTTPVVVPLSIAPDFLPEVDESFTVSLVNPTNGATVGSPSSASVTIVDDDPFAVIGNPVVGGALFGTSVLKVGQRLFVGAPGNPVDMVMGAGEVYVFDLATLTLGDQFDGGPFSQEFGTALTLDGQTLAASGDGHVRVYGLDPSLTLLSQRFELFSTVDGFGDAMIGLGDGRLVIGAPLAKLGGSLLSSGGFGVYDDLTGALLQWMDGASDDRLGEAFARQGNQLLVGAPGNAGVVARFGGSPLVLNLAIPNPAPEVPSSSFGHALAYSAGADAIAIGEPDDGPGNTGAATVFDVASGVPVVQVIGGAADGRLGASATSFGATRVVIGGPGLGSMASGVVAVIDPTIPPSVTTILNPVPTANANFGAALCEFDGVVVVGAPGALAGGKVYLVKAP
jgi:Calx-beta domain